MHRHKEHKGTLPPVVLQLSDNPIPTKTEQGEAALLHVVRFLNRLSNNHAFASLYYWRYYSMYEYKMKVWVQIVPKDMPGCCI